MYWYKGKNSKGEVGTVPGTFLKAKQGQQAIMNFGSHYSY